MPWIGNSELALYRASPGHLGFLGQVGGLTKVLLCFQATSHTEKGSPLLHCAEFIKPHLKAQASNMLCKLVILSP